MARRKAATGWAGLFTRNAQALSRIALRAGRQAAAKAVKPALERARPPRGAGDWIAGVALGAAGARRYHLHRPPGVKAGERLPLMVMLHGCGQDAKSFATSTRMNAIATRERFLVLYPEQDRLANAQGCWNWFDTRTGRAQGEVALILAAIDQVIRLYGADTGRVAICGLSAGASMAALVAASHPRRIQAVAMHSGVPPGAAGSTATALAAMQGRRAVGVVASARSQAALAAAPPATLPPLLVIQGNADHVVASANARAAAVAWAHAGVAREGAPRRVQRGQRYAMLVTDFRRRAKVFVTLVEVDGLGHAWSGGAVGHAFSDPRGPDASRLVWAFAARQFG